MKSAWAWIEKLAMGVVEAKPELPELVTSLLAAIVIIIAGVAIIHAETIWQKLILFIVAIVSAVAGFRWGEREK